MTNQRTCDEVITQNICFKEVLPFWSAYNRLLCQTIKPKDLFDQPMMKIKEGLAKIIGPILLIFAFTCDT